MTNGSIENPRYSPDAESAAGSPTRAVRVAMPLELPVCQCSSRNSCCLTGGLDRTRIELCCEMRYRLWSRLSARFAPRRFLSSVRIGAFDDGFANAIAVKPNSASKTIMGCSACDSLRR